MRRYSFLLMDKVLDLERLNHSSTVTQFRAEPRFKSRLIWAKAHSPSVWTWCCLFIKISRGSLCPLLGSGGLILSEHIPSEAQGSQPKNQSQSHLESGQGQRSKNSSELFSDARTMGGGGRRWGAVKRRVRWGRLLTQPVLSLLPRLLLQRLCSYCFSFNHVIDFLVV